MINVLFSNISSIFFFAVVVFFGEIILYPLFYPARAQDSSMQPFKLKGSVLDVNFKEKYFEIKGLMNQSSVIRIYVDDPVRLRGLRKGLSVRVWAHGSEVVPGAYVAQKIMMSGATCRCDPTGVRARMKRLMGNAGWGCGARSGRGRHR